MKLLALVPLVLALAPSAAAQVTHKVQVHVPRTVWCALDVDELRGLPLPAAGQARCVRVLGYQAPGDGGGGDFYWDGSSVAPEDGGITIASDVAPAQGRWTRLTDGRHVSATWFGALPNDGVDDHAALQAAIEYAEVRVGGLWPDEQNRSGLYLPPGTYHTSKTLRIKGSLDLFGADSSATYLHHTGVDDLLRIEADDDPDDADDDPDALFDVSLRRMTLAGNWDAEEQTTATRFGVYMFHGVRGCSLEDLTVLRCETGIFLRRCYTANVIGCTVMFCTQHCLKWENATAGKISGSRFDVIPTGGHCVFVTFDHTLNDEKQSFEETVGLLVESSSFQGSGLAGLYCRDVGDLTVVDCFFENNNRSDVGLGSLHLEDVEGQPADQEENVVNVIGGFFSPGGQGGTSSVGISVESTRFVNLIGVDLRGASFQHAVRAGKDVEKLNLIGCHFHGRPLDVDGAVDVSVMGSDA